MDNVPPNDPLFSQQWHLNNTGQSGGTPGEDINVLPAWQIAAGDGVVIGIVDGDIQYTHPDLIDNISSTDSDSTSDNPAEFQSNNDDIQSLIDFSRGSLAENIKEFFDSDSTFNTPGSNSDTSPFLTDGNTILVGDNFIVIPDYATNPFFANTVSSEATIIEIESEEELDSITTVEDVAIQIGDDLLVPAILLGRDSVIPDIDDIGLPDFITPPPETIIRPITEEQGEIVYRLFNNELNLQFYTTSELERDTVLQDLPQYESQGISFIAAPEPEGDDITGISPVYRLFNSNTGVHLYTISEAEKDFVVENLPNYDLEGIEYYGYETQIEGTTPLYRFYNQSLDAHFYTPSFEERDEYIADPDFQIEGDGGVAFYVQPAPDI